MNWGYLHGPIGGCMGCGWGHMMEKGGVGVFLGCVGEVNGDVGWNGRGLWRLLG